MKSKIFLGVCIASFIFAFTSHLVVGPQLASQSAKISTDNYQMALRNKATSLVAVGWEGCPWCKKFKEETLPIMVAEGYDVRYVDISEWKGPVVKYGPTLFFFKKKVIVRVNKGFLTAEQVKEYLCKD